MQGEASPASHGPFELSGTYDARFEQQAPEDPSLDFTAQTPFVARLDPHAERDDAPGTVALFDDAARTGEVTVERGGAAVPRRRVRRLPLRDPAHAEALTTRTPTLERDMNDLTLGEAARAIGVSVDTLRRWDRAGKLRTVRDGRNQRRVPGSEVERLRP